MPRTTLARLGADGRTPDEQVPAGVVTDAELAAALTSFGRDRGSGTDWPTAASSRRGDVYWHEQVSQLGVYTGPVLGWRLIAPGTVPTVAARDLVTWAYYGMKLIVADENGEYTYLQMTAGSGQWRALDYWNTDFTSDVTYTWGVPTTLTAVPGMEPRTKQVPPGASMDIRADFPMVQAPANSTVGLVLFLNSVNSGAAVFSTAAAPAFVPYTLSSDFVNLTNAPVALTYTVQAVRQGGGTLSAYNSMGMTAVLRLRTRLRWP